MTRSESEAIVAAWKNELSTGVGFVLIARMPPASYEAMFPISIAPMPQKLIRVGMVFDHLSGQAARADWLPGLGSILEKWGQQLSSAKFAERQEAAKKLHSFGDLAEGYLNELARSNDPEAANAAMVLLKQLKPPATQPGDPDLVPAGPKQKAHDR
jgi:hypothetical protein